MALLCICEQYTVSPLISPLGGLGPEMGRGRGGRLLNRDGVLCESGLIYFSKDDGFSSSKRTKVDSGKAQVREAGGHSAEDQTQIRTCSWWINHPGSVHMKFYSRD